MKNPADSPPMTTTNAPTSTTERAITTYGQQLLCAVRLPAGEIAKRLGVTRPAVSQWRLGYATPGPRPKSELEALYGIPVSAWTQRPLADAPAPPLAAPPTVPAELRQPRAAEQPSSQVPGTLATVPSSSSTSTQADEQPDASSATGQPAPVVLVKGASSLAHVDTMIEAVLQRMNDARISTREHAAILDQWRKLMAMRIQAEARAALMEDATVRHHPKWRKLRDLIIDALIPYPDAARAVEAAIQRAIGDESADDMEPA